MEELTTYEVTLRVYKDDGLVGQKVDHQWTMTFRAENFGHAEDQARDVLRSNQDTDSIIHRIELWL